MNKNQLRDDFISKGYTVQPVNEWRKVATIDNLTKYDANFLAPGSTQVDTAYLIVEADGAASEKVIETARIDEPEAGETFTDRLSTYIRTVEAAGTIFAINVKETFEADGVATVTAYFTDKSVKTFAVKERDNTFSYQELA